MEMIKKAPTILARLGDFAVDIPGAFVRFDRRKLEDGSVILNAMKWGVIPAGIGKKSGKYHAAKLSPWKPMQRTRIAWELAAPFAAALRQGLAAYIPDPTPPRNFAGKGSPKGIAVKVESLLDFELDSPAFFLRMERRHWADGSSCLDIRKYRRIPAGLTPSGKPRAARVQPASKGGEYLQLIWDLAIPFAEALRRATAEAAAA